jgi:gamma-glutamylcyclotransferase (GGCT)/AIG2-like uncharacterized protein YtfP
VKAGDHIVYYGSLRPPFATQDRLGVGDLVDYAGPARVGGVLHDLGAYPAYVAGEGDVVVDLYRIRDARLAEVLDPFEGYDPEAPDASHYVRERVDVRGRTVTAWIYRYNGTPSPASVVESGDWVQYLAEQRRDGTLGPDGGP